MTSRKAEEYKCELSPETLLKAQSELNEDPSTRLIEVKTLRQRLEKTPGLRAKTDTKFLLAFLRARKFDQEKAYQLVKNYYSVRVKDPEAFSNLVPSRVDHVFQAGLLEVLENRDVNGCKVVLWRCSRFDPDRYSAIDVVRLQFLMYRLMIEDEETQVHGIRVILDLSNVTFRHVTPLTPKIVRRLFHMIQDVLPLRVKGIDYVNEPKVFDIIFSIAKHVMTDKLIGRTTVHAHSWDKVHSVVKPEHLPTDFSGTLSPFSNKAWMESFVASEAKFEADNKFGFLNMSVDGEQKTSRSGDVDLGGLGGTFKKLEV